MAFVPGAIEVRNVEAQRSYGNGRDDDIDIATLGEPAWQAPDAPEVRRPAPGPIRVERIEAPELALYRAAWDDLCTRAIEPNVFLEPGFALPLFQHVAAWRRPSFFLVWEESGPAAFGRLLGLFAFRLGTRRPLLGKMARGFMHKLTSCGVPLVDRDRADETIAAVMTALGDPAGSDLAALTFEGLPADGPFAATLAAVCARLAWSRHVLSTHERAILVRRTDSGDGRITDFASAKRRKERARQKRRLSETGQRAYTSARTPREIATATERFLALEDAGWKGRKGTSLLADQKLATFTRTMTRLMANDGKCRIDAIEIDGRPIAMGIVLTSADRAYFWKTSFDEAFATLSPGVQFANELTQVQLAETRVAMTDSCAVADHPMIDGLWPHRMRVVDLMVAPGHDRGSRFGLCIAKEQLRRSLRRRVKALWLATLRLRRLARRH